MSSYPVIAYTYEGSLLVANLFSTETTIILSDFGSADPGTLQDDSSRLYVGEEVTIDGQTFIMRGSGTAQPGINILGLTVPTGAVVDLILLEDAATGQLYFVFPDGVPNALGMIAMVINLEASGYDLTTNAPLCFAEGTSILTTKGYALIETLRPGTSLVAADGPALRLLANLPAQTEWVSPSRLLPVIIRAHAFGVERPTDDLAVSRQHRLVVGGGHVELLYGISAALAPALGLIDFTDVTIGHSRKTPAYRHLLCDRHGVVYANGVMAETLLWESQTETTLGRETVETLRAAFPELAKPHKPALPTLTMTETRLLVRKSSRRAVLGALSLSEVV